MARRCGCSGSSCGCLVVEGTGVTVLGRGTTDNPYVVSIPATLEALDDDIIHDLIANPASQSRILLETLYSNRWVPLDRFTGEAETLDDSTTMNAAMAAARTFGFNLIGTPGKTYMGKTLDTTGVLTDLRGCMLQHPAGGSASNILTPTGACEIWGGVIDGNKSAITDSATDHGLSIAAGLVAWAPTTAYTVGQKLFTGSNGYVVTTAGTSGAVAPTGTGAGITDGTLVLNYIDSGWAGAIRLIGTTIQNCWGDGIHATGVGSLADAENAVLGSIVTKDVEVTGCNNGIYASGLQGITNVNPYTHHNRGSGIYTGRCKKPRALGEVRSFFNGTYDAVTPANSVGYGYVSIHSVGDYVESGECSDNVNSGWCFGGAEPPVTLPGRDARIGSIAAHRNGKGTGNPWAGITFDPTRPSVPLLAQIVNIKVDQFYGTYNGGPGIQITKADYIDFGLVTVDNNGTNGMSNSGKHISWNMLRARNNGVGVGGHGVAVFGTTTEYGAHSFGRFEFSGNGDGLNTIFFNTGVLAGQLPSTWVRSFSSGAQGMAPAVTSTATYTHDANAYLEAKITAQAAALNIANPTGVPGPMQPLTIRIKDNGTARAITYGTQFRAFNVAMPTTTVVNKTLYLGFRWNSEDSKWDNVSISQEL